MRKTRMEIVAELQLQLGTGENTEHLLDWLRDLWETTDLLLKRFGREYTFTIVEAVEYHSPNFRLHDLVVCQSIHEGQDSSFLN